MPQLFSDAARGRLASPITAGATSMTLDDASKFPFADAGSATPGANNNWFKVVIQDEGGFEIAYVRTRNNTTPNQLSNVMRGQEGTTARAAVVGAVVGIRPLASDATSWSAPVKYSDISPPPVVTTNTSPHSPVNGMRLEHVLNRNGLNYVASIVAAHFIAKNSSTVSGQTGESGEVGYSRAVYAEAIHDSSGFVNDIYGLTAVANTTAGSAGDLKFAYGVHAGTFHYGSGGIETVFNNFSETYHAGSGDIDEAIAYFGDASKASTGEILEHITLANKDLTGHANAQYGAILWGKSRLGNNWVKPTHTLEVAGTLDISDNNATEELASFSINGSEMLNAEEFKFDGNTAMRFTNAGDEYSLRLNPDASFDMYVDYLKSNSIRIDGDYGGYKFVDYAPSGPGYVQVTTGGDQSTMAWLDMATYAPKESPAFTGAPTAPTVAWGDTSDNLVNANALTRAIHLNYVSWAYNRTLQVEDIGRFHLFGDSNVTITIPAGLTMKYGATMAFGRAGGSNQMVVAGAGVTFYIDGEEVTDVTLPNNTIGTATLLSANKWVLGGSFE